MSRGVAWVERHRAAPPNRASSKALSNGCKLRDLIIWHNPKSRDQPPVPPYRRGSSAADRPMAQPLGTWVVAVLGAGARVLGIRGPRWLRLPFLRRERTWGPSSLKLPSSAVPLMGHAKVRSMARAPCWPGSSLPLIGPHPPGAHHQLRTVTRRIVREGESTWASAHCWVRNPTHGRRSPWTWRQPGSWISAWMRIRSTALRQGASPEDTAVDVLWWWCFALSLPPLVAALDVSF